MVFSGPEQEQIYPGSPKPSMPPDDDFEDELSRASPRLSSPKLLEVSPEELPTARAPRRSSAFRGRSNNNLASGNSNGNAAAGNGGGARKSNNGSFADFAAPRTVMSNPGKRATKASFSLPPPPNLSDDAGESNALTELQERRELARWAENLYQEMTNLEEDRTRIERELEDTRNELETTRSRCAELERLAQRAGDTEELRKQIEAYSNEVEELRKDRSDSAKSLLEHKQTLTRVTAERLALQRSLAQERGGEVFLTFTVHNVNFEYMQQDAMLHEAVRTQLRQVIAADAVNCGQAGVLPTHVTLEPFTRNSAQVEAAVSAAAPNCSGGTLASKLGNSQTLARSIAHGLENVPGIASVREGPIGVHNVAVVHRDPTREELEWLQQEHDQLQQAHTAVLREHDDLKSAHGKLKELHEEESGKRRDAESRLESNRDDMDHRLQSEEQRRLADRRHLSAATTAKEDLARMVRELMKLVEELQTKYVNQTRHYANLAKMVREQQASQAQEIQTASEMVSHQQRVMDFVKRHLSTARRGHESKEWELRQARDLAEDYEGQVHQLLNENRNSAEHLRLKSQLEHEREESDIQKSEREQEEAQKRMKDAAMRHRSLYNPNIAKAMHTAFEGVVVQKVSGVDPKNPVPMTVPSLGYRMLKVIAVREKEGVTQFYLTWSKTPPYKEASFSDKSRCDLSRVLIVGYGWSARAPTLLPQEKTVIAERCFSVYTPRRSFDFVCQSEEHAAAFVLSLSRLCQRVQGWPVQGSIPSFAKFTAAKGWVKVQTKCRGKRSTMAKHFLEAGHATMVAAVSQGHIGPLRPTMTASGGTIVTQDPRSAFQSSPRAPSRLSSSPRQSSPSLQRGLSAISTSPDQATSPATANCPFCHGRGCPTCLQKAGLHAPQTWGFRTVSSVGDFGDSAVTTIRPDSPRRNVAFGGVESFAGRR